MTTNRNSLPAITRPDSDVALVSEWTVTTSKRERTAVGTALPAWEHEEWPEGLLSDNYFVETTGDTILQYSQWTSEEIANEFVRTDHSEWARSIKTIPAIERHKTVPYQLYRSFVPGGSPHNRECIVVISFKVDGPEWQRKLVDWLVDRLPDNESPGMISSHFHISTDGMRVLNYTEWTDEEAHRDVVENDLQEGDEVPQMIAAMDGVRSQGYKRFNLHQSLAKPLISPTGASTLMKSTISEKRSPTDTQAVPDTESVVQWIRQQAIPLTTLDPQAPLTDLRPLRNTVQDATVVGLGGSARGTHELSTIRHRVLRYLVEELGFRSLALEADWTKGIQLNEYVRTGSSNPEVLLADARSFYQTKELLNVVQWMRSYNEQHSADPLRIVGVDITGVRALAYDAVAEYVRRTAPEQLDELETHYEVLRPANGINEHTEWYRSQQDKQPFIDHARLAYNLVEDLPVQDGHEVALQHARTIVGFYEYHALDSIRYADQHLAENTIWWHEHTADKIVYWGGLAHTANANPRSVSSPPFSPTKDRNAGSYLRDHFGEEYTSVGLTFDHGSMHTDSPVPAPPSEYADAVLGSADMDTYLLDLHARQPNSVQAWLAAPLKIRLIGPHYDPENDVAYHMSDGSLAEWFDVIIHSQEVTLTRLLA